MPFPTDGDDSQIVRALFDDLEQREEFCEVGFFRLDENRQLVGCSAFEAFVYAHDEANRRIGMTEIAPDEYVSTVFLGGFMVFKGFAERLFETMVFGGRLDGHTRKYKTWEDAEKGHQEVVARVRAAISTRAHAKRAWNTRKRQKSAKSLGV